MTEPKFSVSTEHGRYYIHPTRRDAVPSITNIISMKDKPGLKWWAAKTVAEYAAQNRAQLATLDADQAFNVARYTPFRKTDDAPNVLGDIVHGWAERHIKGETPPHDEVKQAHQTAQWMWASFIKFTQHYHPDWTGSEFTVWSSAHGYAGTADFSARIAGFHVLADIKTGKGVYPDTGMQLAALANADVMLDAEGNEVELPQYDRYAILHIRPRSFTLYPVEKIKESFEAFLALKTVFDWNLNDAPQTIGFAPKHN